MKESNIKELVYLMKKNRDKKLSSPIFFLGAGASRTGKIPLSDEIIKDILIKYKDNPRVVNLKDEEKTYVNLMDCLLPIERNELLKEYIEKAKINVTHIYLAQLIKNDYVDYVLTVNFDNLMLRALALFNIFPPTYDMAVLKELTTTTITRKSIVYLHGQHHGLWLLNTQEEMDKVETVVPKILHSIKDRPWIFIGYSGSDPIFDQIAELGRFDKGLFWVTNLNNEPNKCICDKLLNKDNANCSLIKGYDSDSFMLELNASLKLKQPQILEKPFTSLKNNLNEIVDIDEKEHYKGVKERIEIAKKQVEKAISQFEDAKETNNVMTKEETKLDLLKKQIIANLIKKDFNENKMIELEKQVRKLNDNESKIMMSDLYQNSADSFLEKAMIKGDEKLYHESIKKYKKALELHPNNAGAYNNWGAALAGLASLKGDEKLYHQGITKYKMAVKLNPNNAKTYNNWGAALAGLASLKGDEKLYHESIEKYKKALELHPNNAEAYNNTGIALSDLAKLKGDENLYHQGITKYKMAVKLNPNNAKTYNNWGAALAGLASLKGDEKLYHESIEKYKKALELHPKDADTYNNMGTALSYLARLKGDEKLYHESIEKYKKALELHPNNAGAYNNWGAALAGLASLKGDEKLYHESLDVLQKAEKIDGKKYNLACLYAKTKNIPEALKLLELSLKNGEIKVEYVKKDEDWNYLKDNMLFNQIIDKYK